MRRLAAVAFVVFLVAIVGFIGCTSQQVADTAAEIQKGAAAAAPLLPAPFGMILGLVAGGAGLVASIAAAKVKGGAIATNTTPNAIANFISTHTWIYPSVMAAVGLARAKGWIHMSDDEITALFGALGIASVGHVVADAKAENATPAVAAPKA